MQIYEWINRINSVAINDQIDRTSVNPYSIRMKLYET